MKKILQVKLLDLGLKGVHVKHVQSGVRKNEKYSETHKVDYKAPANCELVGHFEGLRQNLMDLCQLDTNLAMEDIHVTGACISPDGYFFQILGKVRSVGVSEVKLTSPRISDDQTYVNWGECMGKVKGLFAEAMSYVKEKKVADPMQTVIAFAESDKGFAKKHADGLEAMSEEQKKDYYREQCEKRGMIVFEQESDEEVEPDTDGENDGAVVRSLTHDEPETEVVVEKFGG